MTNVYKYTVLWYVIYDNILEFLFKLLKNFIVKLKQYLCIYSVLYHFNNLSDVLQYIKYLPYVLIAVSVLNLGIKL